MEHAEALVNYLSDRGGTMVRSAVYYDEEQVEMLYMREDVQERYTEREIERIADMLRQEERRSKLERLFDLGDFQCSLFGFRNGIVMHFPEGGSRGTLVSLDAQAATQFNEFAEECARRIYGG